MQRTCLVFSVLFCASQIACGQVSTLAASVSERAPGAPISIGAQRQLLIGTSAAKSGPTAAGLVGCTGRAQEGCLKDLQGFELKVRTERLTYQGRKDEQEGVRTAIRPLGLGLVAGTVFGGPIAPVFGVATLVLMPIEMINSAVIEANEESHRATLTTLYAERWNDMRAAQPAQYKQLSKDLVSKDPDVRAAAANQLIDGSSAVFGNEALFNIPPADQQAALPFHVELLKSALKKQSSLTQVQIEQLRNKFVQQDKDTKKWRAGTEASIASLSGQISATLGVELKGSLQITNATLYRTLGPRDRLDALNSGLNLGWKEVDLDKEVASLTDQVKELDRKDRIAAVSATASELFAVAQATMVLARAAGIEVAPEVAQALGYAQSAFSIATAFALGPMAGVQAIAGLAGAGAGGGGGDPQTKAALERISEQLDKVIELQQETLQRLDQIDNRIAQNHREEVRRLIAISNDLSLVVDLLFEPTDRGLNACIRFQGRVYGLAPTLPDWYAEVRSRFEKEDGWKADFFDCHDTVKSLVQVNSSRPNRYWLFLENDEDPAADGSTVRSLTDTYLYSAAMELARALLFTKVEGNDATGECWREYMAAWRLLPASALGLSVRSRVPCQKRQDHGAKGTEFVPIGLGAGIDPLVALKRYVHHDYQITGFGGDQPPTLAAAVYSAQAMVAPYYELFDGPLGGPSLSQRPRLQSLAGLRGRKVQVNPNAAREQFSSLTDVMDIAATQEMLMSGAPMATEIAMALQAMLDLPADKRPHPFNPSAQTFADAMKALEDKTVDTDATRRQFSQRCSVSDEALAPQRLMCVLERHPQMLMNALAPWVRSAVDLSTSAAGEGTQPLSYEAAFVQRDLWSMSYLAAQQRITGPMAEARDAMLKATSPAPVLEATLAEAASARLSRQQDALAVAGWTGPDGEAGRPSFKPQPDSLTTFGFVLRKSDSAVHPNTENPGEGWYLKLNRPNNQPWYMPMPTAFELQRLPIRYRPQATGLDQVRRSLEDQRVLYSLHLKSAEKPAAPQRILTWMALKEAQRIAAAPLR